MVGLITPIIHLSALVVGGFGWNPLDPSCVPIPDSVSDSMAAVPMTRTSNLMSISFYFTPLPALSVIFASFMLLRPLVRVRTPTSAFTIALLSVHVGLVPCPALFQEAYAIWYELSMKGCVGPQSFLDGITP